MNTCSKEKEDLQIIWFSRILRWVLGFGFIAAGWIFIERGAWPSILFGTIIFITGFLKPIRCINE